MDISSALELLRNAPTQALKNHRNEAFAALREIEARLRDFDSPHHQAVHETSSVKQPALSDQGAIMSSTKSTNLLSALNKISSWVWKSIQLQPKDVLNIKRPRVHDRRLADIRRVEGDHKAEKKYKLLRALAQRSLALQGEKSGYLDIQMFCEIASSRGRDKVNKGRQGKISKYVKHELAIEEEDASFAIRAIQAGMRQLVMERLLKERLGGGGQCDTASGISAFTALTVRPFRCLKYGEIPEFLDKLLESASMDLSVREDEREINHSSPPSIADIIKKTSVWYDQLQTYYNKIIDIRAELENDHSNKRMRMQISSSAYHHTTKLNGLSQLSGRLIVPEQATIQCAMRSPSPYLGENGNIHFRSTGSEGSSDSFDERVDTPESNLSDASQNIGPETTGAEYASNSTTQIHRSLSARIPRSGTSHSWASMPVMAAWADIPLIEPAPLQALQLDPSNSWANPPAMVVGYVPSHRPLIKEIPQPDASDAWANSTAMAAGRVSSSHPLSYEFPQPNDSDTWANSTAMVVGHISSSRPLFNNIPQPDASDAWANPYAQMHENTSLGLYVDNAPYSGASDAEVPETTTVEVPQSNSWANSAGIAAAQFVSNRRNVPHPDASDAWSVGSARDSALTQTSHSGLNAPWTDRAEVTSVQHPAEVPRVIKKTQPMAGSSLQPRDQPKSGQHSRVVTVN